MTKPKRALLIVDVQVDFCPGGALPVPAGDTIVPVVNQYIQLFTDMGCPIIASRDWHPCESAHFATKGGSWPPHCVANTHGAAFHPDLALPPETIIVSKGTESGEDGYSVFEARDSEGKPFQTILESLNIRELYVAGLATDYCVKASILAALKKKCTVFVLTDAIQGIDPQSSQAALASMRTSGAQEVTFNELDSRYFNR